MRWRFGAPCTKYYCKYIERNNKVLGYVIARKIERMGIPCLGIVDIAFDETGARYAPYLLRQWDARKYNYSIMLLMASRSVVKAYYLKYAAFFPSSYKFQFIFKNLSHKFSNSVLADERSWNLLWVDSDDL